MAVLTFNDGELVALRNAPGLVSSALGRLNGWTPLPDSIGPEAVALATGQALRFRFRRQRAVAFTLGDLPSIRTAHIGGNGGTVSISSTTATFTVSQDGALVLGDALVVAGTTYTVTARTSGTVWTLGSSGTASGAAFTLLAVPLERAARLVAHLLEYNTVDVATEDTLGNTYTGLQLLAGTRPELRQDSARTLRYSLSVTLARIDGSATPLVCRYS
jgi:hypothetical protein